MFSVGRTVIIVNLLADRPLEIAFITMMLLVMAAAVMIDSD